MAHANGCLKQQAQIFCVAFSLSLRRQSRLMIGGANEAAACYNDPRWNRGQIRRGPSNRRGFSRLGQTHHDETQTERPVRRTNPRIARKLVNRGGSGSDFGRAKVELRAKAVAVPRTNHFLSDLEEVIDIIARERVYGAKCSPA